MQDLLEKVVILGGGTAGWMTASYLAKAFGPRIEITLIEARSIPRIGVGEATVPNLQRVLFDFLEIPERVWMKECNASFKGAVRFINWHPDDGSRSAETAFYHHFGLLPNIDTVPLSHYWLLRRFEEGNPEAFDRACFSQTAVLDGRLAPRPVDGPPAFAYAWHFDAQLVADYLAKVAVGLGVQHIYDEFMHAETDDRGFIKSITCRSGEKYHGDLFIDCSGFRGLLINGVMGEPFVDMRQELLCNSAVAAAIPHDDARFGIEPYTSAIAMKHGWTWKIPLLGRFGSGYVYSDNFTSEAEAVAEFLALWELEESNVSLNRIKFRTGRNRNAWVRNCVSIGLSSCFLEPLESTGIYFITASIYQLAKHFPDRTFDDRLINSFNNEVNLMYDDCRDFVQAHYITTRRTDTEFWKANRNELAVSDALREKLELYRAGLPVNPPIVDQSTYYQNFEAELRNFWTNGSYYCIFAGMGLFPERSMPYPRYRGKGVELASEEFAAIRRRSADMCRKLPPLYEYLAAEHGSRSFEK